MDWSGGAGLPNITLSPANLQQIEVWNLTFWKFTKLGSWQAQTRANPRAPTKQPSWPHHRFARAGSYRMWVISYHSATSKCHFTIHYCIICTIINLPIYIYVCIYIYIYMYMYDHIQQVPIPFRSFDTLEFIRTHPSKHKQMANMLQDNARYTCHICALNTYFTWTFTCQWYKICAHVCVCNIYIYV